MKIAYGNSRMEKKWKNNEISCDAFCKRVSTTQTTTETVEEYRKMTKPQQDSIKDVGGHLRGGRRKTGTVLCRSMLTLDMDHGKPDVMDELDMFNSHEMCIYSTHKHTPEAPRLRLIIPLKRDVSEDEYPALARKVAQEIEDQTAAIDRQQRAEARKAEFKKPVKMPLTGRPARQEVEEKTGRASNAYKEDFGAHLRGKRPVHNVLSEGVQADGGYLVPEEFERQIVMGLDEANVVRSLAKVITTSAERKIPVAATHSEAKWTAENGDYTPSDPHFDQKIIDAFKLTDLVKVSIELLQDSMFDLESYIAAEFARAFGIAEEESFCVGTGTGQPTAIFTANGGQVAVTAAANNAIAADDLISLIYSLKSPYRRNAKFLMNDATIASIRKLKDGNGVYLWQPSLHAGEPDKLLGYDLYTSPYVPGIDPDALTVAFGDFKNYWIADRSGRTVQRLNELYSTNGQVGFVATKRVDGKVILPEEIKLLKMKH